MSARNGSSVVTPIVAHELPARADRAVTIDIVAHIPDLTGIELVALGYRRVSKREQATEWKDSLRAQTEALVTCATTRGIPLDEAHIFEDRFSAENAEKRRAFMAMLRYCESHARPRSTPGHIFVYRASRWGRFDDPEDATYWRGCFRRHGWEVVYTATDVTDDLGVRNLVRAVADTGATFERQEIIARAKNGGRKAASLGHWQGRAPFGYRRLACAPGREPMLLDNGELAPKDRYNVLTPGPDEEVAFVEWMFAEFAKGQHSLGSFCKLARERQKTAGPGGRPLRPDIRWSRPALRQKLKNESYLGLIRFGKRLNQNRSNAIVAPDRDCVMVHDAHPALISRELYDNVQAKLNLNAKQRRSVRTPYALTDLVTCVECGSHFRGGGGGIKRRNGTELRYRVYVDPGRLPNHNGDPAICGGTGGTIARLKLERAVVSAVHDLVADPALAQTMRATLRARLARDNGDAPARAKQIEKRAATLRERRQRLIDAVETGTVPHDLVRDRLREIEGEEATLDGERLTLARGRRSVRSVDAEVERLTTLARDFTAVASQLEGFELRERLVPWIQSAVFDKRSRVLTLQLRRVPGLEAACSKELITRRFHFGLGYWNATPLGTARGQ
jgi:DNA invertase Pin-like site-specific DNA recombinase